MTFEIRNADHNDFAAITDIAHRTWPVTYQNILSKPQLDYMLELFYSESGLQKATENGQKFLLLSDSDVAVGFGSYEVKDPLSVKINKLYVLPDRQGKGYGKLLLDEIEKRAVELDAQQLILNVNRNNKAIDFYKHLGFSITGSEDIDIGNGYFMMDYIMARQIP